MVNWEIALQSGLKQVASCFIKHTHIPPNSAQIVANTLHTFLTSPKSSQAKCQQNCEDLINNKDIQRIRSEYLIDKDR